MDSYTSCVTSNTLFYCLVVWACFFVLWSVLEMFPVCEYSDEHIDYTQYSYVSVFPAWFGQGEDPSCADSTVLIHRPIWQDFAAIIYDMCGALGS